MLLSPLQESPEEAPHLAYWKPRHFILTVNCDLYYTDRSDATQKITKYSEGHTNMLNARHIRQTGLSLSNSVLFLPDMARVRNIPPCLFSNDTSRVPPPRSMTNT